ncbi:hypothetical protein TIFTF001_037598 [Ficus carica]|uniref:Uncharacterized protein n=1 Tax=Ficus carica TaxID=3494 RepID=A0AA88E5K9_FICCA|nr:hypothetical protein TIFTF001_037598 [Ficus carica]
MYQPFQQSQPRNLLAQLHSMQAALDGPRISEGLLEALPLTTNAKIFTMTKEEAAAEISTAVTGMDFLGQYNASIECRRCKVVFDPK